MHRAGQSRVAAQRCGDAPKRETRRDEQQKLTHLVRCLTEIRRRLQDDTQRQLQESINHPRTEPSKKTKWMR